MQERLLKFNDTNYIVGTYPGNNASGIVAFGNDLVVQPDEAAATAGRGIILVTEEKREQMTLGSTSGIIMHLGPAAFEKHKAEGRRPKPGDHIIFTRYAGQVYTGLDGKLYRIMSDESVGGWTFWTKIDEEKANG